MTNPTVVSHSSEETGIFGVKLADLVEDKDVVTLNGELGSGKTHLVKGLARGLGIDLPVTSPTFVLMREYRGRRDLFHLDLYRGDETIYLETGATDFAGYLGVTVIEWGERIEPLLERSLIDYLALDFSLGSSPNERLIMTRTHGPRSEILAKGWIDACTGL